MAAPIFINEGSAKIEKTEFTFYNPAQKFNRDISLYVIKEYFKDKEPIKILDAMSATGLRGIRYLNEIPNSSVVFNDISENAVICIKNNLISNMVQTENIEQLDKDFSKIRVLNKKAIITRSDCNLLMCSLPSFFDVIDIDPFGSCSEYIDNAIRSIKNGGIICFTATDKAVFCVNEEKCEVKYSTKIYSGFSKNEMALRVLLSCISRYAAKFGVSIEPLLSVSVDFYIRVFVKIIKRSPKSMIQNNRMFFLCSCNGFKGIIQPSDTRKKPAKDPDSKREIIDVIPSEYLDKIEYLNLKKAMENNFAENKELCFDNTCFCPRKMYLCGPFWHSKIHNEELVSKMILNNDQMDNRCKGILYTIRQEIDTPFYYEIPKIAKYYKTTCIRMKYLMNSLTNLGFKCSLTHCELNAIKTDAKIDVIVSLIRISEKYKDSFLFKETEYVDNLLSTNYYKGLHSSGMGPLSLPKK